MFKLYDEVQTLTQFAQKPSQGRFSEFIRANFGYNFFDKVRILCRHYEVCTMTSMTHAEYLSVGGNRNSAASAWSAEASELAYGADINIALWRPFDGDASGVHTLLRGHTARVTAVSYLHIGRETFIASGDANGRLCLWSRTGEHDSGFTNTSVDAHNGAVNVVVSLNESDFLASGGADAVIKIWRVRDEQLDLLSIISTKPRYIPLTLALGKIPDIKSDEAIFVVGAGTRNDISIYAIDTASGSANIDGQTSLTGHEGWIHSLALRKDSNGGYLLASASSDKYVRLWQFSQSETLSMTNGEKAENGVSHEPSLNAKRKYIVFNQAKLSVTFEALLLGHEDWVYHADWQASEDGKLLTASADGTLAIWEPDPTSGIWISETRLGEISGQKGATTATGSSGGFWKGFWLESSSNDNTTAVISLGRTGSWRMWEHDAATNFWQLRPALTGHTASVNGLSWSKDGSYLLSTGSDQTTRLHAEWRRGRKRTWHEFSRPQIHGYDLNCISCTGPHQFASGADEKLLRVFNEPRELAQALERLCHISVQEVSQQLPDTAAIPVLGLSNKAQGEPDDILEAGPHRKNDADYAPVYLAETSVSQLQEPPTEDLLSRHTLWPELEKLYGHGYEISECAYSSENGFLATSCKASSLDHAVIRLYDTNSPDWREIKPALTAHSLTVTRLVWSPRDHLLSVGRDRQWTLFQLSSKDDGRREMKVVQAMPKAHTRMILDCACIMVGPQLFFATAGRDKSIKLWLNAEEDSGDPDVGGSNEQPRFSNCGTIVRSNAITAVDFTSTSDNRFAVLAAGEEDGAVSIHIFDAHNSLELIKSVDVATVHCPTRAINRLLWRKNTDQYCDDGPGFQLAVASIDSSVRILRIDIEDYCGKT